MDRSRMAADCGRRRAQSGHRVKASSAHPRGGGGRPDSTTQHVVRVLRLRAPNLERKGDPVLELPQRVRFVVVCRLIIALVPHQATARAAKRGRVLHGTCPKPRVASARSASGARARQGAFKVGTRVHCPCSCKQGQTGRNYCSAVSECADYYRQYSYTRKQLARRRRDVGALSLSLARPAWRSPRVAAS
jgi:hypothetical protein